jgi:threonine aldolase
MIDFRNDYAQGAHEQVLGALAGLAGQGFSGYGEDDLCRAAQERVRRLTGQPEAALYFLSGGTQANLTVIASILRPHQGVVAADTAHIAAHETGAIEATGHKVLTLPHRDGKVNPDDIERMVAAHYADDSFEHMVQPGMVYISNTTELGSIYTARELEGISRVCRARGLPLYLDGARLGYALASEGNDLTLAKVAALCDAFTIGLTKQGALFGEAVVIVNPALQKDFRYIIKQRGGMLAKGWLMGAQFEALMTDDLYGRLSRHAVGLAMRLKHGLREMGVPFLSDSPSNQQFPILPNDVIVALRRQFAFHAIEVVDESHTGVRFCTSWYTNPADVETLLAALAEHIADSRS